MTDLTIRAAGQADLPALLDLYRHLDAGDMRCPAGKAATILERFLSYAGSAILVGHIGADVVASCTVVVIPNLTRGGTPYALIENVVTDAGYRNRGLGKAILRAAVEHAWSAGCYKAMLMTGSKKPSTLAFYEAAGFEQSKTGFQIRRLPVRAE
ncbi:MAG TPA: GNAT family N-acetyltransferase [Mycoplana sp.]|nr:GNAT family N-acetyltransferase [Mycoplana sp.]